MKMFFTLTSTVKVSQVHKLVWRCNIFVNEKNGDITANKRELEIIWKGLQDNS